MSRSYLKQKNLLYIHTKYLDVDIGNFWNGSD